MSGTAANTLAHQFARLTRPHYHPKLALGKHEKEENGTAFASPSGGGGCGAGDTTASGNSTIINANIFTGVYKLELAHFFTQKGTFLLRNARCHNVGNVRSC